MKNPESLSNLTPLSLTLDELIELNLNLIFLSGGQYCIRQLYDIENSIAYHNYACEAMYCEKCIKKWREDCKAERND